MDIRFDLKYHNFMRSESQRHSTAYTYYLQLGGERSYAKVADKFGFSETSVRKWAKSFDWEQRVTEADLKANAGQRQRAEKGYIQTVEDFRSLKHQTLAELKSRVESGGCTIMELIQILRIIKVELGEPTHITTVPKQAEYRNPFEGIFQSFFGKNATPDASIVL